MSSMEEICLKKDNGEPVCFQGRLFSECSHFDEDDNCLTRQQLYVTETGEQIYYIIRSIGKDRQRSIYRLQIDGENCIINNGEMELELQIDQLLLAVRGLCGLTSETMPSQKEMEEIIRAANG